jgi:hypothetical protein
LDWLPSHIILTERQPRIQQPYCQNLRPDCWEAELQAHRCFIASVCSVG